MKQNIRSPKAGVERVLAEVVSYGGLSATRKEVYQDCITRGLGHLCADRFAFTGDFISDEDAAALPALSKITDIEAEEKQNELDELFSDQETREELEEEIEGLEKDNKELEEKVTGLECEKEKLEEENEGLRVQIEELQAEMGKATKPDKAAAKKYTKQRIGGMF